MRWPLVSISAFALIVIAFSIDALTPQTLVVAILLDVPIVLVALAGSRRLTIAVVVTALLADGGAAFINAAHDGYRWEPIGLGDRALSIFSILLVGFLSTEVQERAERVGRLAAQEARARREATLATVAERIRASLSSDLVLRAVVREATVVLKAQRAVWYPAASEGEVLAGLAGSHEIDVIDERAPPEIATLVHRVADNGTVAVVRSIDPVGRLVLDRLAARSAVALPFADRGTVIGVLIVAFANEAPGESVVPIARAFSSIAVNAIWQSRLFEELSERNEALRERQAVIQDLVYAISHDVRTPLAALSLTMRHAAGGAYGGLPDEYLAVLRDSLVSIDDLQRLAETLLIVARFEASERPTVREPVDLEAIARENGSELQTLADARRITLTIESQPRPTVQAARADLRRAVSNLVANALHHTPAGGTVSLRIAENAETIDVVVTDDGYGIAPELRSALFGRFVSGPGVGGGTGLGLYIVRRIAGESGGSVAYAPAQPRGSVFTLTIPKVRP